MTPYLLFVFKIYTPYITLQNDIDIITYITLLFVLVRLHVFVVDCINRKTHTTLLRLLCPSRLKFIRYVTIIDINGTKCNLYSLNKVLLTFKIGKWL